MADNTGLEETTLGKAWEEHPASSSVWTDPLRAKWLRDNGYGAPPAPEGTMRRKRAGKAAIEPILPAEGKEPTDG